MQIFGKRRVPFRPIPYFVICMWQNTVQQGIDIFFATFFERYPDAILKILDFIV